MSCLKNFFKIQLEFVKYCCGFVESNYKNSAGFILSGKIKKNCVFKENQEKSGRVRKFYGNLKKVRKSLEFLPSIRMNSLVPNRQLYTLHSF